MKQWQNLLFVLLVLALLLLPAAGLFAPAVPFAQETPDMFVNENIAFRKDLISLNGRLSAIAFRQSGSADVILGRDGWLFFGETLDTYLARTPLDDAAIASIADRLADVNMQLQREGKAFLFLCAPDKNTLYSEQMPAYYIPASTQSDMDRLFAALDARGVPYLDARMPLRLAKAEQPVYHRTDSHWNAYGALSVYRAVMAHLQGLYPSLSYEAYADAPWREQVQTGDLMRMWMPAGAETETITMPEIDRTYHVRGTMRSVSDMIIRTESDRNTLRMCFIRDSFGDALFPYFANNTGSLAFTRLALPDALASYAAGADVVVLEIAERNLGTLE